MDSSIDVEAFVRARLVTRLGRITNKHFTTGTGGSQPNGLITAATVGQTGTTGLTLTVIYDDLVDLDHSVDSAYRDDRKRRFMTAGGRVKTNKKVKDSQERPNFLPSNEQGNHRQTDT